MDENVIFGDGGHLHMELFQEQRAVFMWHDTVFWNTEE